MDIQQKLDSIQLRNEKLLKKTPAEHNADKVDEMYREVLHAKQVKDDAPDQLKDAEENYYKARYGDQYMDVQQKRYTAESKDVLQDMMDAHQRQMTELENRMKTYASSSSYFKNIEEVKQTWFDKIKKWIHQIQNSKASVNHRKTFYADQEKMNLSGWIRLENCILLSFVLVTVIMEREQLDNTKIGGMVALLCILFFTNTLFTWLRYLPKSLTFYTQWGYDPMESKLPWLLVMTFVVLGALSVVYVNSLTAFFNKLTLQPSSSTP